MAMFIALHQMTPHMDVGEAAQMSYRALKHEKPDIRWLRYWWSDDTGRMVCLWEAANGEAVWDILHKASIPTDVVFQVEEGDPALLRMGLKK